PQCQQVFTEVNEQLTTADIALSPRFGTWDEAAAQAVEPERPWLIAAAPTQPIQWPAAPPHRPPERPSDSVHSARLRPRTAHRRARLGAASGHPDGAGRGDRDHGPPPRPR